VILTVVALSGGLLAATPASANHNADDHSNNMVYEGTSIKRGATNSDLAFWGNRAYAGNYAGFRIIDITNPRDIENPANVIVDFACPGPQNDISVWDSNNDGRADLLFLSVDSPRSNDTCENTASTASNADAWEGVRIFDISDERNPQQVAAVPTDCGSHTHTLVPGPANSNLLYVYVSSYPLGAAALTETIAADQESTPRRAAGFNNFGTECRRPHARISIIRVPLNNPAAAVERTPTVNAEGQPTSGFTYPNVKRYFLDGATRMTNYTIGGTTFAFKGCHDISVFTPRNIAAAACWEEAQYWNISDPWNPGFLRRMRNREVDTLWHSATFTWDGRLVALEDEAGGGGASRCVDPNDLQGRMWFYNLSGHQLSSFKIPRSIQNPCTAHNYNFLPLTDGRYILASAWYAGGTSMIDVTDPTKPTEIGHYITKSPANGTGAAAEADTWSSYWYNGFVYANDGLQRGTDNPGRGLDVFSFNHPATATAQTLPHLNPQTQTLSIAQTYTRGSTITASYRKGAFRGSVRSPETLCQANRPVLVRRLRRQGGFRVVARGRTDATGRFIVNYSRRAGTYRVAASRVTRSDGANSIVCKGSLTGKIVVR
jgi:hypothetical protein